MEMLLSPQEVEDMQQILARRRGNLLVSGFGFFRASSVVGGEVEGAFAIVAFEVAGKICGLLILGLRHCCP